ncbi:phage baseplate assembly protein V [Marinobacter lacisalsi]|uniref:Phage baseplate assembly protein V n=1 Tax=Marinobacter lacisalsi TaxID=475979 RepID=A0ABV8QMV6_9GAMM
MNSQVKGVVIGLVENLDDPEELGRIQVRYPWLEGEPMSNWARVVTLFASAGTGMHFRPEIGDEAVLAFDRDDINHPFILGFVWSGENTPPELDSNAQRLVTTIAGHRMIFDDDDSDPSLIIEDAGGSRVTLNGDGIMIESSADLTVKGQNISVEAGQQLTLKGNPVHINP